jgi:hypothetical protein
MCVQGQNGTYAWSTTCVRSGGGPCDGLGIPDIACAEGPTTPVCTRNADGSYYWRITCEMTDAGTTDASRTDGGTTNPELPAQEWGGKDVGLAVDANSAALTFDCGSGTIDMPFTLAADGSFKLSGTYLAGTPIPTPTPPKPVPAFYSGIVNFMTKTMTLVVEHDGTSSMFVLAANTQPTLSFCQ